LPVPVAGKSLAIVSSMALQEKAGFPLVCVTHLEFHAADKSLPSTFNLADQFELVLLLGEAVTSAAAVGLDQEPRKFELEGLFIRCHVLSGPLSRAE